MIKDQFRVALVVFSVISFFSFEIFEAGFHLLSAYPLDYSWTDLMINYQGGFVRRGLLGELAFHLDPYFAAPYFLIAVVLFTYIGVTIWMVTCAMRRATAPVALLFLLSPTAILFPIYDPAAFGRKDIFILGAFALTVALIRYIRSTPVVVVGVFAIYVIAGLNTEATWFYFPLSIATLSLQRLQDTAIHRRLALWVLASTVATMAFLGMVLTSHPEAMSQQHLDIINSWRATYPDAYNNIGALPWIGAPLHSGWEMVIDHQSHLITLSGYLIGFLLANVPLLLAISNRKMGCDWFSRLEVLVAVTAMLVAFAAAADWGRYTYLFACHAFMFAIITSDAIELKPTAITWRAVSIGCLGLFFLSAWQLKHFALGGTNPLRPGLIFNGFGL